MGAGLFEPISASEQAAALVRAADLSISGAEQMHVCMGGCLESEGMGNDLLFSDPSKTIWDCIILGRLQANMKSTPFENTW